MAELVYAYVSEAYVARLGSSSLPVPTIRQHVIFSPMKKLGTVTLLGVDCVNIDRLILAAEICMKDFEFAEVKLLSSIESINKHVVKIPEITTVEHYSRFMVSELNRYVNTPHVLVIQYDGFILNPAAWTDKFLKYDYIGAPWLVAEWSVKDFNFPKEWLGKTVIGNGGFSLRTKKFLETCADLSQKGSFEKYHPEDVMLTIWKRDLMEQQGIKFAPVELAKKFSYEAVDDEDSKWSGQLGFHGIRWTDISNWSKDHQEFVVDVKKNEIRRKS